MDFFDLYFRGLVLLVVFFSAVWLLSVYLKNASIVDIFWGLGYVLVTLYYLQKIGTFTTIQIVHFVLVAMWGLRLSVYIFWRNYGKPEDFRYQEFRQRYGAERYWWFSFFQVFLLQGVLVWLISAPLLSVQLYAPESGFNLLSYIGFAVFLLGFVFESGGDFQMARFKSNPANKGKTLQSGFWKYTRHPNYFGDAAVWWGFALFSVSAGSYLPVLSSVLMTFLLLKVSGVAMLEKTLVTNKSNYSDYMQQTSAFFPWFPKKK